MLSPLARALPAMTALQATVALGIFALAVLAPQRSISVAQLAGLNTLLFTVGTFSALCTGRLLRRLDDWMLAAGCAACIAAGMACLLVDSAWAPWCAAVLFGLAFGPETPASASVLSRLTSAARRPWVFSVRQTGNQIGAIAGSLALPVLAGIHAALPFVGVGVVALATAAWCWRLSRAVDLAAPAPPQLQAPISQRGVGTSALHDSAIGQVLASRPLRALSLAALCYAAVQVCLNTFLMSLAVHDWRMPVATASLCVAGLQAAGLAGRLFWGWRAPRGASATPLLGGLGLLIAASGTAVMAWPGARDGLAFGLLIALLGFSASGWNGVLVAEVARLAGPREAGRMTGTVLMFSYAGLAAAPLSFAAGSQALSGGQVFTVLFIAAGLAGAQLLIAAPSSHR